MTKSDSNVSAAIQSTRAETRAIIDAPLEEVWKSLTESNAFARWFAPKMSVEPGVGGFVLADFGPGLEWKTFIEVWEPNRHLRLVESRAQVSSASPVAEPPKTCRLVQDYYLEAEGGKTVLRLVHSGFGSSSDWDGEYNGTRGGWPVCFLRLKHGLEKHRNESTHNLTLNTVAQGVDEKSAHQRIEAARPKNFKPEIGDRYERAGVLPDLNDSIFNYSVQPGSDGAVVYIQFLLFGLSDAKAATVENEWRAKMAEMFPASGGQSLKQGQA